MCKNTLDKLQGCSPLASQLLFVQDLALNLFRIYKKITNIKIIIQIYRTKVFITI